MARIAILATAQTRHSRKSAGRDDVEMVQEVLEHALERARVQRRDVGFFVSGSCDFLVGRPFTFVGALDGVGAVPAVRESHVEMDGAWALYEAFVRLHHGDIDVAVAYAFGRSSAGDVPDVLALQLDPYIVAPLWPDSISIAAMQARALLDSGRYTERDFAAVGVRNRAAGASNPNAHLRSDASVDEVLAAPYISSPLRKYDCPPISDGAAAVVLATETYANAYLADHPDARVAWISGIDHRIEPASLGVRELATSPSTALAAERAGAKAGPIEIAELHAPFAHQELILRDAIGLGEDVVISPSGGAMCANPIMVAGLVRIAEAAEAVLDGRARRTLAHATSGPALQHNLVCVMEGGEA